jgi:hypothetical protein
MVPDVYADDTNSNPWHKLYFLGKFTNSYPPKPDQIFIAQYKITNATLQSITGNFGGISTTADTSDKGLLEIKFPRNFPYSNQGPDPHDFFILINGFGAWSYYHPDSPMTEDARKQLLNTVTRPPPYPDSYSGKDDCYYLFSIPFYTYAKIDIIYGFNGLILSPYQGESIPQYCNKQTMAEHLPPLKQISWGIEPKKVKCDEGFDVILHPDAKSISCVKIGSVSKLVQRGWIKPTYDPHVNPKVVLINSSYDNIDTKGKTLVSIGNQTYYQITLEHSVNGLKYGEVVKFENVTFSFPNGLMLTTEGGKTTLDIKFQDGYEEIYERIPTMFGPYANNAITLLSNHAMPQAGLTYYKGEIKLLVSATNISVIRNKMKRNLKIIFSIGFLLLVAGIILALVIQSMEGAVIELRTLEATLAETALLGCGLITIGIGIVYNQFGKKVA